MNQPPTVREGIAADIRRVADRLRNAPLVRVTATAPLARSVLQLLADGAQGIDARAAEIPPSWREVPELIDSALGDQLAVLGADFMIASGSIEDADTTWTRAGRAPANDLLAAVAASLRELRSAL